MRLPFVFSLTSLATALVAATSLVGHAQEPPPARATGSVQTGVTAVLVDVVVRDRRGLPVRDLTEADFEITEDGVRQRVSSFKPVFDDQLLATRAVATGAAAAAMPGAVGGATATPRPDPSAPPITALVFDRLSPEGKQLAVKAAKGYFGDKAEAPTYFGVYGIDLSLRPYQGFTRDTALLRAALDQIDSRASASFGMDKEKLADVNRRADSAAQGAASAEAGAGQGGGQASIGSSSADALLQAMQARMLTAFEAMERDEAGYTFVNGLFAIIDAMRPLPGRKSIMLFSEGIAIPPAVQRLFLGVIDAANRANVSIYTMDAAGLRATSQQAEIRDAVNDAAKRGLTGYASNGRDRSSAPLTKLLEKNEDVLRQDAHTGLAELSENTGGLLFENTNDLKHGFERLESDLHNYYLLGYTPTNPTYDGTFRKIDVRVKRSGVSVGARKGYFAVRDTGGGPVNTWEAPAIGVVEQRPVPNAFAVRASALSFPGTEKPGAVPVVVQFKTAPMSFPLTEDQKSFKSDFAVVVRFLDAEGKVVRKVGQHYEMAGELAQLDIAKNSDVLFYREPILSPGVYTMQTIVYDHPTKRASVRYATVEVPRVDAAKLRISSLLLVDKSEKVREDEPKDGPLFVKDVLIYPSLSSEVSKAAGHIGFFFTVYPGAPQPAPQAFLELIQNGKPLARVPLPLEAADSAGRIQQLGRLPLDAIAPGTYELRAVVQQGNAQVFSSSLVKVTD